jgi:LmbE family N-acetylglucosaminyl deacetylase
MFRILCITAHPDDEVGPFGGSLMLYRERGAETHVLCLTPGQAATYRGTARTDAELAVLRRNEFTASCEILGVTSAEVLDYPDGGLDRLNWHEVVGRLVEYLRRLRPQVVLTMGPDGSVTGHPDHSMVSLFTTAACQWAGRSDRYPEQLSAGLQPHRTQKLYYSTAAFTLPDRQPISPAPATAVIHTEPYLERKMQAFHAHKSQEPLFAAFESTIRNRGKEELFHLVATCDPSFLQAENDLLVGVTEE